MRYYRSLALVLLFATFAFAGEKPGRYVLFTQTYDKTVKFTRDLSKDECEFALNRLLGKPATKAEKEKARIEAEERQAKWEAEHKDYAQWCKENPGQRKQEQDPDCGVLFCDKQGKGSELLCVFGSGSETSVRYHDREISHGECFLAGE